MSLTVNLSIIGTTLQQYQSTVDGFHGTATSDCSPTSLTSFSGHVCSDPFPLQRTVCPSAADIRSSSPIPGKLDANRNILPNPKPILLSPNSQLISGSMAAVQPMMTQTRSGEIAVVVPQHLLKQSTSSQGLVLPLYTPTTSAPERRDSQPVMISINMTNSQTSSSSAFTKVSTSTNHKPEFLAPTSPVWRPW